MTTGTVKPKYRRKRRVHSILPKAGKKTGVQTHKHKQVCVPACAFKKPAYAYVKPARRFSDRRTFLFIFLIIGASIYFSDWLARTAARLPIARRSSFLIRIQHRAARSGRRGQRPVPPRRRGEGPVAEARGGGLWRTRPVARGGACGGGIALPRTRPVARRDCRWEGQRRGDKAWGAGRGLWRRDCAAAGRRDCAAAGRGRGAGRGLWRGGIALPRTWPGARGQGLWQRGQGLGRGQGLWQVCGALQQAPQPHPSPRAAAVTSGGKVQHPSPRSALQVSPKLARRHAACTAACTAAVARCPV